MKLGFTITLKCDECDTTITTPQSVVTLKQCFKEQTQAHLDSIIPRLLARALDSGWTLYSRVSDHQELSYCPWDRVLRNLRNGITIWPPVKL